MNVRLLYRKNARYSAISSPLVLLGGNSMVFESMFGQQNTCYGLIIYSLFHLRNTNFTSAKALI